MARKGVFLGLGSNLGDRERHLAEGLRALARRGFRPTRLSALYETEPVGGPPQGWFLNVVAQGETDLAAEELLEACLAAEGDLGRERQERWGPRTLDVDILLFDDELRDTAVLTVPHPRLAERLFVLAPLAELASERPHPRLGQSLGELLARCPDRSQVRSLGRSLTGVLQGEPS
jgi:2-amino-4-hydroxy-6-hydroxymethyldihydropteridine diphosphokinase